MFKLSDARRGFLAWKDMLRFRLKFSDEKVSEMLEKEMTLEKQYLLFPILNGAKKAKIDIAVDGNDVRYFDAEIATDKANVSFWAFLDITAFKGKIATLRVQGASEVGLGMIFQDNRIPGEEKFYTESLRPQFHFSQKIGWNNDPNGMVYHNGKWHIYFQHNPYGWNWGNMHWGHAVSEDLIHWKQLPIALYPCKRDDWVFSGGATVDEHNTAGWQTGRQKVIVASWTSTGRGECIAYSNDDGTTFTEYEGNPVIKHNGRDPKVIWYAPGKHWVMAVYNDTSKPKQKDGRGIAFYTSKNLKQWTFQSKLMGYYECPEIFELPIDGDKSNTKWVIFAADAQYAIGSFDGKVFTPDHKGKHRLHYGAFYASQTFSDSPDGRRIQIGWARINMEQMPFNQMFTFPHRLTLRTTPDGTRMFAKPIKEIEKIHKKKQFIKGKPLKPDAPVKMTVSGRLFDIRAEFDLAQAKTVGLDIGGTKVVFDGKQLFGAPIKPVDGKIRMQILVDRSSIEVCGNDGRVCITKSFRSKDEIKTIEAFCLTGYANLNLLEIHELNSIWT